MRRVLVLQHETYEVLGTLDEVLKREHFRIRYVNFDRDPDAHPTLDKYNGLILLGGYMGVYESDKHPHLKVEMQLIEEALKKQIPILGICLGSQILAHVLGSDVRKHTEREMGWYDVHLTPEGKQDHVLGNFRGTEKVFQSHGDTFDIPKSATHLAWSELCSGQAFRYGTNAYGLQFHLEVNPLIVKHWLECPQNGAIFSENPGRFDVKQIQADTQNNIDHSMNLSLETFKRFLEHFGPVERRVHLGSGHGKNSGE